MTAMDHQAPATHRSTTAADSQRDERLARLHAQLRTEQSASAEQTPGLTDEDGTAGPLVMCDDDGDTLELRDASDAGITGLYARTTRLGAYLNRRQAQTLYHRLGDWLMATEPADTEPLAEWERELLDAGEHADRYVDHSRATYMHADGQHCVPATDGAWLRSSEGVGAHAECHLDHSPTPLWELEDAELVEADRLDAEPLTVTAEAERAVYGDRHQDYGHPREDFTRTAILWTGLLHHKLQDGESLDPEDVGRCLIAVKLARDVHAPKRDNRVDMAGYALTLDRLETGR